MAVVEVNGEFGYVILIAALACIVNMWMAFSVGRARKTYGVHYPALYADETTNDNAVAFNCIQRGHQNSLENLPMFFTLLLLSGLQHPRIATAAGLVYIVGRIFYFIGYSSGDPSGRTRGMFYVLGLLTLLILSIWTGISLVLP